MSGESRPGNWALRATNAWARASRDMFRNYVEANRALFSVATPSASDDEGDLPGRAKGDLVAPADEVDYRRADWEFERSVEHRDSMSVGDTVEFSKRLTDEDVRAFARASGDTNRLHLDDEFAERTRFGGRIVHGTLVSGLVSAALARLPGLTIYLSQDLEFHGPVGIGDRVTARCRVVEDLGEDRFRLRTSVENGDGEDIIDGEAVVLVDELPDV